MPGQASLPELRVGNMARDYIPPGFPALRLLNTSGNEVWRLPAVSGQNFVFNEQGDDIDVRIEGDSNANLFRTDAGLFTGVGAVGVGGAAVNTATLTIDPPAMTAVAATNYSKVRIDNSAAVTVPAGTTALVTSLHIGEPNITATGTVTSAVTLYIEAAPTEGGTNNLALWVDDGNARFDGNVLSTSTSGGIGYGTGAGGTVTQMTNKSTGVTLNRVCGQITMNGAALNAGVEVGFTVTNSAVAATDTVIVNIASGATADSYLVGVDAVAGGSFRIVVSNVSAGNLSEAIVINFAVIKAVSA